MSFRKFIFDKTFTFLKCGMEIFGKKGKVFISAHLVEQLAPVMRVEVHFGHIDFFCPGKLPHWRAKTLLDKEPETIEWLETFDPNSVFWDIGANVGVYSLYAALRFNIQVLAFEPSAYNYYILNKNIEINGLDNRLQAYCVALNDATCLDRFFMKSTEVGAALHSFSRSLDSLGEPFQCKFKQGMIGISVDDFLEKFKPPFPTHIKIDVDGNEGKIIAGAKKTFSDRRLKSVLVELSTASQEYVDLMSLFENFGFKLLTKRHNPILDNGKYASIYNHIFVRSSSD